MVNEIDNNLDLMTTFHDNPDVPAIIETDPERIALIMKNQKTNSKLLTSVGDYTVNGKIVPVIQIKIYFPEQTIVYNRRPSKEWYYLLSKTNKIVIMTVVSEGMGKGIATFPNVGVDILMDKRLGFRE